LVSFFHLRTFKIFTDGASVCSSVIVGTIYLQNSFQISVVVHTRYSKTILTMFNEHSGGLNAVAGEFLAHIKFVGFFCLNYFCLQAHVDKYHFYFVALSTARFKVCGFQ
jgi:hypothetical protein